VQFNATMLGGITALNIDPGIQVRNDATGGEVFSQFQSINAIQPVATFTSKAIKAALDLSGLLGLDISTLGAGLNMFAYKHASAGTRAGETSHRKYNVVEGLVFPRRLVAAGRGDADLNYEARITQDGSANDPIIVTKDVTLPQAESDDQRFALGPVTIESVLLTHLRSFELAFGLTVETEGDGSSIYDTFASIATIQPVITLRGIDLEWLDSANIPWLGKVATHTNTAIYLRRRASGGSFVADEQEQHIKITAAGLATIGPCFDAAGATMGGEVSLTMPCKYDGTNNPVIINTASTIT